MKNNKKSKKKVAILSVADLRHMTCVNFYCEYMKEQGIEFDFICMNRYRETAGTIYNCGLYQYECILPTQANFLKKMTGFYKFKKYADSIINNNHYDFIIVWGENAAWLFNTTLKKHGNYCVNVRDFLEGKSKLLEPLLKSTMRSARFITIPSPQALDYLGIKKLLLLNKDYQVLKSYTKKKSFTRRTDVIQITYMGVISDYISTFQQILSIFKNDNRFIMAFYGKNADIELKEYAKKNNIHNVILGGEFSPDKTGSLLEETDIINSIYGTENSGVKVAVGVKESYGPLLHIPVLSDEGSYFAKISEENGFGKGVIIDKNMPDIIYDWYINIVPEKFDFGCDKYCEKLEKTNSKVIDELDKIFIERK